MVRNIVVGVSKQTSTTVIPPKNIAPVTNPEKKHVSTEKKKVSIDNSEDNNDKLSDYAKFFKAKQKCNAKKPNSLEILKLPKRK